MYATARTLNSATKCIHEVIAPFIQTGFLLQTWGKLIAITTLAVAQERHNLITLTRIKPVLLRRLSLADRFLQPRIMALIIGSTMFTWPMLSYW
jgi:hypothetical protein